MGQLAVYLHPAAAGPPDASEDFLIDETDELRAYLATAKPASDRTLVPVEDLVLLVDDPRLRAVEGAHVVMVVRRG